MSRRYGSLFNSGIGATCGSLVVIAIVFWLIFDNGFSNPWTGVIIISVSLIVILIIGMIWHPNFKKIRNKDSTESNAEGNS